MEGRTFWKRCQIRVCVAVLLAVAWAGLPAVAAAGAITLRGVTAWPQNVVENAGFFYLRDELNRASGGSVRIEYAGGPESIPTNEQIEAVRLGVVDLAWVSASYTVSIVPEAHFFRLSQLSPQEERARGVYDAFNRVFQRKANSVYLGRGIPGAPFHLFLVKPVRRVEDFRGLRIRVSPNYLEFVRALGAAPITTAPTEIYSALERGLVDGLGWPGYALTDWNFHDFIRYRVDPGFYQVDTILLMNKNTWDRLPPEARRLIMAATEKMEAAMLTYYQDLMAKELARFKQVGVQVIQLPEPEARAYLDLAYRVMWDTLLRSMPESGREFEALLARK